MSSVDRGPVEAGVNVIVATHCPRPGSVLFARQVAVRAKSLASPPWSENWSTVKAVNVVFVMTTVNGADDLPVACASKSSHSGAGRKVAAIEGPALSVSPLNVTSVEGNAEFVCTVRTAVLFPNGGGAISGRN